MRRKRGVFRSAAGEEEEEGEERRRMVRGVVDVAWRESGMRVRKRVPVGARMC